LLAPAQQLSYVDGSTIIGGSCRRQRFRSRKAHATPGHVRSRQTPVGGSTRRYRRDYWHQKAPTGSGLPSVHEIVDRAVLSRADCPQQKGRRRPSLSVRFGPEGDASRGTGIACTARRVSPRLSEIAVTRTATGTTTAPAFAKGLYRGGGGWHGGGGGCALIVTGCATEEALTS
jgi:hypothetical protein